MNKQNGAIIVNGSARSASKDEVLRISNSLGFKVFWTDHPGHAKTLTKSLSEQDFDCLVVCGGDGSINEVANGLMSIKGPRPPLGIIPFGTGNDLCRTLGIPLEADAAVSIVKHGQLKKIDVAEFKYDKGSRFFLNASGVGFSGLLGQKIEAGDKAFWGPLAYIKSGIEALGEMKPFVVKADCDGEILLLTALNLVVCNGRSAGGGIPIAPKAMLDDGLLDLVIYAGETFSEHLINLPDIYSGQHLECENVIWRQCRRISLSVTPAVLINLDGEIIEDKLMKFSYKIQEKELEVFSP